MGPLQHDEGAKQGCPCSQSCTEEKSATCGQCWNQWWRATKVWGQNPKVTELSISDPICGALHSNSSKDDKDFMLQILLVGGLSNPNSSRQHFIIFEHHKQSLKGADLSLSNSNGASKRNHIVERSRPWPSGSSFIYHCPIDCVLGAPTSACKGTNEHCKEQSYLWITQKVLS